MGLSLIAMLGPLALGFLSSPTNLVGMLFLKAPVRLPRFKTLLRLSQLLFNLAKPHFSYLENGNNQCLL